MCLWSGLGRAGLSLNRSDLGERGYIQSKTGETGAWEPASHIPSDQRPISWRYANEWEGPARAGGQGLHGE